MTEEKLKQYLAERRSTIDSSFKVPNGYFDTFCDSIMNKLPVAEAVQKPRRLLLHKRLWQQAAATIFIVATISLTLYEAFGKKNNQVPVNSYITEEIIKSYEDDNYVDDALDYAMIDNSEIAAYLTGY